MMNLVIKQGSAAEYASKSGKAVGSTSGSAGATPAFPITHSQGGSGPMNGNGSVGEFTKPRLEAFSPSAPATIWARWLLELSTSVKQMAELSLDRHDLVCEIADVTMIMLHESVTHEPVFVKRRNTLLMEATK